MYSSGTTGLPKGIVHTHYVRAMYGMIFAQTFRIVPESIVLHAGSIVFNGAMVDQVLFNTGSGVKYLEALA